MGAREGSLNRSLRFTLAHSDANHVVTGDIRQSDSGAGLRSSSEPACSFAELHVGLSPALGLGRRMPPKSMPWQHEGTGLATLDLQVLGPRTEECLA